MIEVDTRKMRETGNKIIEKSNRINKIITSFYSRIDSMPTKTGEWVGNSASEFARKSNIQKEDYIKIKNIIYNYGTMLIKNAEEYEKKFRSIR